MSFTVVYEGSAKTPRYQVEWGSRERSRWSSKGGSFPSLESAKEEAAEWELEGYDTRILLIEKEKN